MKKLKNIDSLYKKILVKPQNVIQKLDLVYVDNDQLPILRKKKRKNKFWYEYKGEIISNDKLLKRIDDLKIPPAWEGVKITDLENGHLQAVGRDLKERKQYIYHSQWTTIRNRTKYYKMLDFGRQLPKIRRRLEKDLDENTWSRDKVIALVIKLMEETHIRIGSRQYAKRNQTYGLSTLRSRHLKTLNNKIRFQFVGKKGKEHKVTLRNKKLVNLVNECHEIPGWELFKFFDEKGNKQKVDSSMVNEYLHDITDTVFTAKDFRTWAGTVIFFETLYDLGYTEDEKENKNNIITAYDVVAEELGNTRAVCREYYVHPAVVEAYQEGNIEEAFDAIKKGGYEPKYFSPSEKQVLKLIENFNPLTS